MPAIAAPNGKRIACVGAGPASLTVARDLAPLGYEVTVFDGETKAGGFIRSQIPRFRLPESVIDEETGYILDMGVKFRSGERVESMQALLKQGYDAVFVGCGAPRGRDLDVPGRSEAAAHIHIGIDWLPRFHSAMSPMCRPVSSCSVVAIPRWIVAVLPVAWGAPT
jgi:formate dehydrogenase beta subunit